MQIRYCAVDYPPLMISKISLQYFLVPGRPWTALWNIAMQQYCFTHYIHLKTVPFYARKTPFQGFLPLFYLFVRCLVFVCRIWYLWSKVMAAQHGTYSVYDTPVSFFTWCTSCFGKIPFLTPAKNSVIL